MSDLTNNSESTLSIGALSKATGVPVPTLRTWERRYGYPTPERSPGGHRLYSPDHIEQIALVTDAIERGHRPSEIFKVSRNELADVLGLGVSEAKDLNDELMERLPPELEHWLDAVCVLDGRAFDFALRTAWAELGGMRFLEERIAPFLIAIGHLWAKGSINVLHEHFASERLRDFMSTKWRQVTDVADGANVFCTTLPGEQHSLGLHMAATVLSLAGVQIPYFGINTPIESTVAGVKQAKPKALVVSVSAAANQKQVTHDLIVLRAEIPKSVQLIIGGSGAPDSIKGAQTIRELGKLRVWAEQAL